MLPYLFPYRVRWISMIVVAITSLGATVSIPYARPVMRHIRSWSYLPRA